MGVAKKVQFRGGTTTSHQSFTGAEREVTVDITKKTLVVHDGITLGGIPLAKELETQNSLDLKTDNTDIESVNLLRADKYLASQDIVNMLYVDGNLSKIRYNNDTDVNYETFGYTLGNLTSINHYVGSVLKGTTTLSYTDGNLVSAIFVGV